MVYGTFVVDPDRSGGTLSLGAGFPFGFADFRFSFGDGLKKLYLVSADNMGTMLSGDATKQ